MASRPSEGNGSVAGHRLSVRPFPAVEIVSPGTSSNAEFAPERIGR